MSRILIVVLVFVSHLVVGQEFVIQQLAPLPIRTTNNAVAEGFIDGKAYVYSFGGIDFTKLYSGIHQRCFRLDVVGNTWEELAPLPDDKGGKIASSANRVGDIIYIIGGYHVAANGSEVSSSKVHRFDIKANAFLEDGADIPTAIDDQVQVVKDHLIYVITGWSNNQNVALVQVYNTLEDSWARANNLLNSSIYKVFGAAGAIVGDTIYYYGGAGGAGFAASKVLRKGVIDPDDPLMIDWSTIALPDLTPTYRTAACSIGNVAYWFGGSHVSYNYDGIAYNGSGGVDPTAKIFKYTPAHDDWSVRDSVSLPMDLRGLAEISASQKIFVGGMKASQEVTNEVVLLSFDMIPESTSEANKVELVIAPNPVTEQLIVTASEIIVQVDIMTETGILVKSITGPPQKEISIDLAGLETQMHFVKVYFSEDQFIVKKILKVK